MATDYLGLPIEEQFLQENSLGIAPQAPAQRPAMSQGTGLAGLAEQVKQPSQNFNFLGWLGDTLRSTGAGLQGQPDPTIQRRLQEAQLARQQEEMQLRKRQQAFQELETGFNFLKEVDIPDEYKTPVLRKWAERNPIVNEMFGGHIPSISMKGKALVREAYEAKEGEIVFGVKPQPAGIYDFEGYPKDGQWVVTKLKANKEAATQRRFEEAEERRERHHLTSQAGIERRHQDTVRALTEQREFRNADTLRKEFLTQSKEFVEVRDSFNRIAQSAKNPSPAGDMSMIFAYMKMLDPRSVVRESEFRTAETARPLVERAKLSWDAVKAVWEGKKLTPSMRADFLNRAEQLYGQQESSHLNTEKEFRRIAASSGLDPEKVIVDLKAKRAGRVEISPEEIKAAKRRLGISE